jgi:ABC-2 type transport system ATP-binding protein
MNDIIVNNLSKTYNKDTVVAVDNVSFEVEKGALFGLIGPDGAGKTSIFRVLTTLLLPSAGTATVAGYNVVDDYKAIRKIVGYMPGKFSLYQDLTVEENLNFFATLFNTSVAQNYDLIKDIYVQIEPFKTRRAGKLSGGMKQKLALCCALIHSPKVLFLDEPTTGVDAVSRKEFWEMLKRLKEQGITILVSTPYMDEASLCDRIALIQDGKIMSIAAPNDIIAQYPTQLFAVKAANMSALLHDLRLYHKLESCFAFGEMHHISFKQYNNKATHELLTYLQEKQHKSLYLSQIIPTIEDCFIHLMNQQQV